MSTELIDETVNEIRRNWNITLQDEINPIPLALELLQQTNPAHDFESFVRLYEQLETSMEWIIENNYTGFNGAVSTFGGIVDSIKECKKLTALIKSNLQEFRDQIQYKRTDLPELWAKIEQYKLRIAALTTLSEMKKLRGQAKKLMEKKFYVPAARVLTGILDELKNIGSYVESVDPEFFKELREDKEDFLEKILEEFCLHIFLKVPTSTTQLVAHALDTFPSLREFPNEFATEQKRQLAVVSESDLVMVPTEFNFNPESNALAFLHSLFQSAHCLGCLAEFSNAIEQRLASELFQIADSDLKATHRRFHRERNVKDFYESGDDLLVYIPHQLIKHHDKLEVFSFAPFLRSCIDTLLVKFAVIMSTFRDVSKRPYDEASADIVDLLYNAAGKYVHDEVRNVLGTLLQGGSKMNLQLVNSAFNSEASATATTQSKTLFRMVVPEETDDRKQTSFMINGLLSERERMYAQKFAKMIVIDNFSSAKEEFGHKPVVKPSLQYLPLLYPAFDFFQTCLRELGLEREEALADSKFLEKYFTEDFVPFIDAYANQELTLAFNSLESLVPERIKSGNVDIPLVEGKFSNHIPKCFKMFLDSFLLLVRLTIRLPSHQSNFETLILSLSSKFLERSETLFKSIGTCHGKGEREEASKQYFSYKTASNASIRDLLKSHPLLTEQFTETEHVISEKEAMLLEKLKNDRSLIKEEVNIDHRNIHEICLLQRGFELLPRIILDPLNRNNWLVDKCSFGLLLSENGSMSAKVLTFSEGFSKEMNKIFKSLNDLSFTTLLCLRLELRSQSFYYLDLALRESNYSPEEPTEEPDHYVTTLVTELKDLETIISDWFPYSEYQFCTEGLSPTLQHILISGFRYIKDINENGYEKLQRTVKSLEQLLAMICPDDEPNLESARCYYDLAQADPHDLIEAATSAAFKYTHTQYQAILDAHYRLDLEVDEDGTDEASVVLRKEYQNQLVRLQYLK